MELLGIVPGRPFILLLRSLPEVGIERRRGRDLRSVERCVEDDAEVAEGPGRATAVSCRAGSRVRPRAKRPAPPRTPAGAPRRADSRRAAAIRPPGTFARIAPSKPSSVVKDRAALHDDLRTGGHAGHDRVRGVDLHFRHDRAAHEILGPGRGPRSRSAPAGEAARSRNMLALLNVTRVPPSRTKASSARTPTAPIPPS